MGHHDASRSSALAVAVELARLHLDGGRRDQAATMLGRHLAEIDPDTADDDPVLIDAACLYAQAVEYDRDTRLRWAAYAFEASRHLHNQYHPRTLAAARVLVELAQGLEPADRHESDRAWQAWHREHRDQIADGAHLLRGYLTMLIGLGRTADVRRLTGGDLPSPDAIRVDLGGADPGAVRR
jgi:hypothetical protein